MTNTSISTNIPAASGPWGSHTQSIISSEEVGSKITVASAVQSPRFTVLFVTADGATVIPKSTRPLPDHMYVDAGTVTKKSSLLVLLICLFSLGISILTDFDLINPIFSIIGACAAAGFYVIGRMLCNPRWI